MIDATLLVTIKLEKGFTFDKDDYLNAGEKVTILEIKMANLNRRATMLVETSLGQGDLPLDLIHLMTLHPTPSMFPQ